MSPPTKRAHSSARVRSSAAQAGCCPAAGTRSRPIAFRQLRLEVREHVQIGPQRLAIVHVLGVNALPEKCFAGNPLQTREIDFPALEEIEILLVEIVADDGRRSSPDEKTRGQADIGRRSAEHPVHFAIWRLDSVIRDGTNNNDGHCFDCSRRPMSVALTRRARLHHTKGKKEKPGGFATAG